MDLSILKKNQLCQKWYYGYKILYKKTLFL